MMKHGKWLCQAHILYKSTYSGEPGYCWPNHISSSEKFIKLLTQLHDARNRPYTIAERRYIVDEQGELIVASIRNDFNHCDLESVNSNGVIAGGFIQLCQDKVSNKRYLEIDDVDGSHMPTGKEALSAITLCLVSLGLKLPIVIRKSKASVKENNLLTKQLSLYLLLTQQQAIVLYRFGFSDYPEILVNVIQRLSNRGMLGHIMPKALVQIVLHAFQRDNIELSTQCIRQLKHHLDITSMIDGTSTQPAIRDQGMYTQITKTFQYSYSCASKRNLFYSAKNGAAIRGFNLSKGLDLNNDIFLKSRL